MKKPRVRRVASSHWVGTKDTGEEWVQDVLVYEVQDEAEGKALATRLRDIYQAGRPFVKSLVTWAKPFMGARPYTSGYFVCRTTAFGTPHPEVNTFVEYAVILQMDSRKPRTCLFRRRDSIDYDPQRTWCDTIPPLDPRTIKLYQKSYE